MVFALASVIHNNQSLLYVSHSWNFRHRLAPGIGGSSSSSSSSSSRSSRSSRVVVVVEVVVL